MRLIIRHISPLIRSRRRYPFVFIISLLLCTAFVLFIIDRNHQPTDPLPDQNQELISIKNKSIILDALIPKTTTVIQK